VACVNAGATLTAWLRSRSDEQLAQLLTLRAELGVPVPAGFAMLAARAGVRTSVARALDQLDTYTLELLELCCLLPEPAPVGQVLQHAPDAGPTLGHLQGLALLWGNDELQVVHAVRELLGPYLLGLGRPLAVCLVRHNAVALAPLLAAHGLPAQLDRHEAVAALAERFDTDGYLTELVGRTTGQERELLDLLAAGPPVGSTTNALRIVTADAATTPLERLLAAGLIVGIDEQNVELPREVGVAVRGGLLREQPRYTPPSLKPRPARTPDQTAALAANTVVRASAQLLEDFGMDPPAMLRSGGLGVRELRNVARRLDITEPTLAVLIEVAAASNLLDVGPLADPHAVPTNAADLWLQDSTAERWYRLALGWLEMDAVPALIGSRDEALTGGRPAAALTPAVHRHGTVDLRFGVLTELASVEAGEAVDPDALRMRLRWRFPRRGGRLREVVTDSVLAEAELLGVTGSGALTTAGRALLDRDSAKAIAAMSTNLPALVRTIVIQADLTALAAGPLPPELDTEVRMLTEIESTGGAATVFRFTETGVRRALDAGRTAQEIHALLDRLAKGAVPQTLSYLIDDVARRHGVLRVGTARSYLRCDDPALLAEVTAARSTSDAGLRRVAPTIAVSPAPVSQVLEVLRSAGYAPVAETADGAVVISRPDQRRLPSRLSTKRTENTLSAEQLAKAVRSLRTADEAVRGGPTMPVSAPDALAAVQEAVAAGNRLRMGYVNRDGATSERLISPISVSGGYFTAFDEQSDEVRTFALARVTGLATPD
jgi:hypothetical protein